MKPTTYTLELLTPCFCAGADQSKAEIRAAAIRGQLRWWFRALGGTSADERNVFGGVACSAASSAVTIRVSSLEHRAWSLPKFTANDVESYVYYFASVSGTAGKGAPGPRWTSEAIHGPGTTFQLQVLQRRPLPNRLESQFSLALDCFLQLGSIGLRATRGLGAFCCKEKPFLTTTLDVLRNRNFGVEPRLADYPDDKSIAKAIGSLVKGTRKANNWKNDPKGADTPSPLGASKIPGAFPRQTSAIFFRPVRALNSKSLQLVVFEAPHDRVLGAISKKPPIVPGGLIPFIPGR